MRIITRGGSSNNSGYIISMVRMLLLPMVAAMVAGLHCRQQHFESDSPDLR